MSHFASVLIVTGSTCSFVNTCNATRVNLFAEDYFAALSYIYTCLCSFKDKEVQRDSKMVSYDVIDKKGKPNVQVEVKGEKKTFSPEEISAMILGKMKETAGVYHLDVAE